MRKNEKKNVEYRMNDDADNVIEEDKKQHPKCGYSKQYSKEVFFLSLTYF